MGDALSMRHPLTGGGMTVALKDAVLLVKAFGGPNSVGEVPARASSSVVNLQDWQSVALLIKDWFERRKPAASTIAVVGPMNVRSLFNRTGI